MSAHIEVAHIPDGHVIVGYVVKVKVLDENGVLYWASREDGLNDMESVGMAQTLADEYRNQMLACSREVDDG